MNSSGVISLVSVSYRLHHAQNWRRTYIVRVLLSFLLLFTAPVLRLAVDGVHKLMWLLSVIVNTVADLNLAVDRVQKWM